ncbi:MAG: RNA polymerase sigma-70 factor [Cyclobacteriaceae bacterium]
MELAEIDRFKALKEGDETAFEMIFKVHYESLCNYAYSFLLDRDEAEEVVQATFLNVWEKRENITIETSVKSYLYRAVRNSCLNAIKHTKIKKRHAEESMATSEKSYESSSQSLISSELDQRIGDALMVLPEQCRLIFKMSRFEELKYSEIADQLNISIKTVENQIGKALKIMREQLKEYLPILIILMNGFIN